MKEREYIKWLRETLPSAGIGDDAAVVKLGDAEFLWTTDMLVEGTHFPAGSDPRLVGRKAVAVSLSDIAAMGGAPVSVVVSVCFRRGYGDDTAREVFLGAKGIAEEYWVSIAGGDTTSSDECFSVCTAVLGRPHANGIVSRSGAKEGHDIMVTGKLGGSIRGKHFNFVPRVREVEAIMDAGHPSAMIDVSDGLAVDISHIVEESGVGATLFGDRIPISDEAEDFSMDDGRSFLHHAFEDGEDYELLLTAPQGDAERILALELDCGITWIGRMGGEGIRVTDESGEERPLKEHGYEHEW